MFDISIPAVDRAAARAAHERIGQLTKPAGSLGRIEELAEWLAAIHGGLPPTPYDRRAIVIGAGDHGVAAEGVSAYPSEVTPQMVGAFVGGFAAINAFARVARAEVFVANFGVAANLPPHERLFDVAVGRGTRNFAREAAMPPADVEAALAAGVEAFDRVRDALRPADRGAGRHGYRQHDQRGGGHLRVDGRAARRRRRPRNRHRRRNAAPQAFGRGVGGGTRRQRGLGATVASEVGGYEIVGLAGVLLAAAKARVPILLDGFIVGAAALLARRDRTDGRRILHRRPSLARDWATRSRCVRSI